MPGQHSAEPPPRRARVKPAANVQPPPSTGMSTRERERRVEAVKAALARLRARRLGWR